MKIRQTGDELQFENTDPDIVSNYFGLGDNLPQILREISKDENINRAVEACRGVRILKQEPWECLISYICATFKNIAAIKRMVHSLSRKFGSKINFYDHDFYTFPRAEKLAEATTKQLRECGLGYRARYVIETSKIVRQGDFDFEFLKRATYDEARTQLLRFPGVGLKVADCVMLFSLGKFEAFPVDVRIKRAVLRYYADHFPKTSAHKMSNEKSLTNSHYEMLSSFGRRYFGQYAGYAQEYLYHYERTQMQACLHNREPTSLREPSRGHRTEAH
jgi:N-glycosylase/DNA lyase